MNGMKAQILTATLLTAFSGVLSAADPTLLNLVMPDAKVLAGVNVQQAKGTQFGQYVLNELQTHDAELQKLVTLTGFDPRRDVSELLVASDGVPGGKSGLALAKGTFDVAKITAAATMAGVTSEVYGGVTILEEPKKQLAGIAFLDANTVVAGDIASVKGAIDRSEEFATPAGGGDGQSEPVEHFAGRVGHHDGSAVQPGPAGKGWCAE